MRSLFHRPLHRLFHKLHRCWVLARRLPTEQQFSEGEAVNYAGLLFVLDSRDDSLIHIAIPLDDFDPSEIPEMVQEAREIFVDFVRERPSLKTFAEQRALQIRVVASYDRFDEEIGPRVRIDHWLEDSCLHPFESDSVSSPVQERELGCRSEEIRRESK